MYTHNNWSTTFVHTHTPKYSRKKHYPHNCGTHRFLSRRFGWFAGHNTTNTHTHVRNTTEHHHPLVQRMRLFSVLSVLRLLSVYLCVWLCVSGFVWVGLHFAELSVCTLCCLGCPNWSSTVRVRVCVFKVRPTRFTDKRTNMKAACCVAKKGRSWRCVFVTLFVTNASC